MSTQIRGNKQIKNITIQNEQIANGTIELDKLKEGSELIKRDGSVVATGDFDLGSHNLKNLAAPVDANDAVRKADLDAVIGGSIVNREIPTGSVNGTNTQFTLANTPNLGTEQVFVNGALLNAGANSDYVLEGDTITFTIAPQTGDTILVNYITDMIVVSLDINTTLSQFNSRLTTSESELFTAQGDIVGAQTNISNLQGRVTTAESDIVALEGDVSAAQGNISTLQSSVSTLQSGLSSEISARQSADSTLSSQITTLQSADTTLGNRVTAVEGDIASLETADATMDLRVGDVEDGLQAETSARTSADNALSSRVTALENAPDPVTSLSALSDVTITSPSANQILKYNGTGWVNGAAPSTFSGSYNDLTDKPSLFSGSYTDLTNKPTLFSGAYADLTGKPTLFSGSYTDLTNKPTLFSGSYNDLTNKPTIPSLVGYATESYVDAAVAGVDLSAVETRLDTLESDAFVTREIPSGSVNGSNAVFTLANTPVSGSEQVFVNGMLQESGAGNDYTISGDTITFASAPLSGWKVHVSYATGSYMVSPGGVSFSGSYNDLTDKPTLFSGSYTDLTNKPTLFSGAYADLTGKPTLFSGSYNDLTNKPTIPSSITEDSVNSFNTSLTPASGTLTLDVNVGTLVLGALSASVTTWAFTNVPASNSKVTTVSVILEGNSARTYGDACSVNGVSVSGGIKWVGGSAPTASNGVDVISFTIMKDASGNIKVLGSSSVNFS